jgi:hypothetical protein
MVMSKKEWLYFAMFAAIMTAGTLITKLNHKRSVREAERELREAAKKNDASARFKLQVRYHRGAENQKNETPSLESLRKAAEDGDPQAQFDLAMRCRNGSGAEKDDKQAVEWLRKAAAQGHAEAQKALKESGN